MKIKPVVLVFFVIIISAGLYSQSAESININNLIPDIFFEQEWSLEAVNFDLIDQNEEILMEEAEDSNEMLEEILGMLFSGLSERETPDIAVSKLYQISEAGIMIIEAEFDRAGLINALKKAGGELLPGEKFKYYGINNDIYISLRGNLIIASENEAKLLTYMENTFYKNKDEAQNRYLITEDEINPEWALLIIGKDYFAGYYYKASISANPDSYTMTYSAVFSDKDEFQEQKDKQISRQDQMKKQIVPQFADDFALEVNERNMFFKYSIIGISKLTDLLELDL